MHRIFAKGAKTQNLMFAEQEGEEGYHEVPADDESQQDQGGWSAFAWAKPRKTKVRSIAEILPEPVLTAEKVAEWLRDCSLDDVGAVLGALGDQRLVQTSLKAAELVSSYDDSAGMRNMTSGFFEEGEEEEGRLSSDDERGRLLSSSTSLGDAAEDDGASPRSEQNAADPADTPEGVAATSSADAVAADVESPRPAAVDDGSAAAAVVAPGPEEVAGSTEVGKQGEAAEAERPPGAKTEEDGALAADAQSAQALDEVAATSGAKAMDITLVAETQARELSLPQNQIVVPSASEEQKVPLLSAQTPREPSERDAAEVPSIMRDAPIVQFGAFEIIATEEDREVKVEVLRVGNLSSSAEVAFRTVDGTAMAGAVYQETSGICHFAPGEDSASILVPLIDDDEWRTTQEFYVELVPNSLRDAQLGPCLRRTKIVVIDNDTFPTNAYQDEIRDGVQHSQDLHAIEFGVSDQGLVMEFLKFLWRSPLIWRDSLKTAMVDFCHSLFLVLKLILNVVLVDHVLKETRASETVLTVDLVIIVACSVVPFGVLHYFDYHKTFWKVRGYSRTLIQTSLVSKFLDFKPGVRSAVNHGGIIMAITRDAVQIIDKGFMSAFKLAHSVTNVAMLMMYQFLASFLLGATMNTTCIIAMLVYPMLLFVFVKLRRETTTRHLKEMRRRQDEFVDSVDALVQNLELVKAYSESDHFMRQFDAGLRDFNKIGGDTARVLLNNARFPQWLTVIAVGLYTIIGGQEVVAGALTLGSFLANIRTLYSAGKNWGGIYMNVLLIQSCVPNLQRVVVLQNLPLEVVDRMPFSKYRSDMGRRLRRELSEGGLGGADISKSAIGSADDAAAQAEEPNPTSEMQGVPAVDLLPLRIPVGPGVTDSGKDFVEIKQGRLVYLIGPHGGGKSALLRFLALSSLPDKVEEGVFVPPHLRVMYLTTEAQFFFGTLKENLALGIGPGQSYSDDQIKDICRRVGLPISIRKLIGSADKQHWTSTLSVTQRLLLSLARVLISNPDMLCIGKFLQHFDDGATKRLLKTLREFVDLRGLCQDPTLRHLRRPRTVIMTTSSMLDPSLANDILLVKHTGIHAMKTDGDQNTTS